MYTCLYLYFIRGNTNEILTIYVEYCRKKRIWFLAMATISSRCIDFPKKDLASLIQSRVRSRYRSKKRILICILLTYFVVCLPFVRVPCMPTTTTTTLYI